jgi:hypothetical protein
MSAGGTENNWTFGISGEGQNGCKEFELWGGCRWKNIKDVDMESTNDR